MKNKFLIISLCTISMVCSLCACGKTPNTAAPANETVGMPNPMVSIDDASKFESELGIKLIPNELADETQLYIIDNNLAEIDFNVDGIDGEDIEVTFRASKSNDDISGVYDDNMTSSDIDYGTITITNRESEANNTSIYDFTQDTVHYCLIVKGTVSQMLIGELLDGAFLCAGISIN